ncbi:hypothetical protein [Ilumatobacter sp.]|uniref:hypothetical protein n=1 Tax=Ilumatobacter sp. TaxID=1967498 RepID=UPI003AF74747
MTEVVVATESDVDDVIALESRLFAEDSGIHEPYADVEWPEREDANDFTDLLANADAIVLRAGAPRRPGWSWRPPSRPDRPDDRPATRRSDR